MDCLQALSRLKAAVKHQRQTSIMPSLTGASNAQYQAQGGAQPSGSGVAQPEPPLSGVVHKAAGSMGSAAAPGRHRRSASWVQRRASSLDDVSAAALAGALLAGPRAAHQKSNSHDSGLPGKLPGLGKQPSRLSHMAADSMADGGQLQESSAFSSLQSSVQRRHLAEIMQALVMQYTCT